MSAGGTSPRIGILALQGAVEPHEKKLRELGATPVQVRTPTELATVEALIIPGGESTTFLHLIKKNNLWEDLQAFVRAKPVWGICAGAIVLAKKVSRPGQESFGVIDIDIERNAYGRQINSFIANLSPTTSWPHADSLEGVFIRAPRIVKVGGAVKTIFYHGEEPVMVEEKNVLASSFHPELSAGHDIHRYFLSKVN